MKKHINDIRRAAKGIGLLILLGFCSLGTAQTTLPETKANIVSVPITERTVNGDGQIVKVTVIANTDYTIDSTPSWIKVSKGSNGLILNIDANKEAAQRIGTIVLGYKYKTSATATQSKTVEINITQSENALEGVTTGMSLDDADFDVFEDKELLSSLKKDVTGSQVAALTNPLARTLAQQMYEGTYDTTYRVHRFKCTLTPSVLASNLKMGTGYTDYQNPTGIIVYPGRTIVIASGIPSGKSVQLLVKKWYASESATAQTKETYTLKNGVNVINRTASWRGLSYLYYFDSNPEKYDSVGIHIVNGQVNGYFDWSKTNAQWDEILDNAKYEIIDMIGERAQSVYPVADLKKYASGKGRWLLAAYDSIVWWEQRLLGLEKYNLMPENRILSRVNYSYYMFRDADGVAFKYDQMYRTCSPEMLTKDNYGVCWGMAHEWGHVHQTTYFKWGGLTETSNNVNTLDVIMRMGYGITTGKQAEFDKADEKLLNNSLAGTTSSMRSAAYSQANKSINSELCLAMKDSVITSAETDPDHALSYLEITSDHLVVYYKLFGYMEEVLGMKDFLPDFYQCLRNTPNDTDEYSKAAVAQNSAPRANVVPHQLNFIRKVSMQCGYNLYPFFEKYGYFRTVALYYKDYSWYYYLMDKTTRDNFKQHMDDLVTAGTLKAMPDGMLEDMLNFKTKKSYSPDWSAFKN